MNQSKFSLADVLTLLTALAFGFVCFLGTNFFTLGNTNQSVILSVVIAVLLSGTALGAKLFKLTSRNFKTCYILELFFLVLFTISTLFFAYSPFSHYFVVSEQKIEIQEKLNMSIAQAENMFEGYENYAENRENLYKSKLRSVAAAKNAAPSEYAEYGFENNGIDDSKQIENKMFAVHADLFPTNYSDPSNNDGIKEIAMDWLSDAKDKITGWKPIGIVGVVNEVEQSSTDWLNTLIDLSAVREKGERTEDFSYDLLFGDVKKYFNTLGEPTILSIGLAVLSYFLMLLSYMAAKRHTRFPGVKILFGKKDRLTGIKKDEVII